KVDNLYKYKLYFNKIAKKIRKYKILPYNIYNIDKKGFLISTLRAYLVAVIKAQPAPTIRSY
ncbi:hypothetical protein EJ08DRAFT_596520, partial [Tothia fuscella]